MFPLHLHTHPLKWSNLIINFSFLLDASSIWIVSSKLPLKYYIKNKYKYIFTLNFKKIYKRYNKRELSFVDSVDLVNRSQTYYVLIKEKDCCMSRSSTFSDVGVPSVARECELDALGVEVGRLTLWKACYCKIRNKIHLQTILS